MPLSRYKTNTQATKKHPMPFWSCSSSNQWRGNYFTLTTSVALKVTKVTTSASSSASSSGL